MELNQALDVVQQIKNHYQAYDKLEEVIQTVMGANSNLAATQKQLARLEAEVSEKSAELKQLEQAHVEKTNSHAQAADKAETAHRGRLAAMEEEASTVEHKLKDHLEELGGRVEAEIVDLQKKKRHLEDDVAGLGQAKEELETVLQELKARFSK